jgi:L-asparaginase
MNAQRPAVSIVATGGSISGIGPHRLDYVLYPELGKRSGIEDMLARIPEARELAELSAEDLIKVGSPSIGPAEWLQLAGRIHALLAAARPPRGVVVTHGTATLEETAYFLHLTVKSERPVVVTGAMRPPTAVGTDADLNLLDAIRLAACPAAAGRGVLTVLNNEIQSARDVTKSNTFRVETFNSRELGLLGYVDSDGKVVFYRDVTRLHTTASAFDVGGATSPCASTAPTAWCWSASAAAPIPPPSSMRAGAPRRRASRSCSPRARPAAASSRRRRRTPTASSSPTTCCRRKRASC